MPFSNSDPCALAGIRLARAAQLLQRRPPRCAHRGSRPIDHSQFAVSAPLLLFFRCRPAAPPAAIATRGFFPSAKPTTTTTTRRTQEVLTPGTTHVAVGFVDLGTLLFCILKGSAGDDEAEARPPAPLRWVGVEMSPYCVAKTLVVEQLIRSGAPTRDILQAR